MTSYLPAYRMTVYAPRSVDPAEATILTPPGGAIHSDQFKVITLPNVAGWKPYLGVPTGRAGRITVLERTTDSGSMAFDLLDSTLVPGLNANRWVTAFLGNASGDQQFGGLRCKAEESLDGGATWADYWTGYTKALSLTARGKYQLVVRDMMWDLMRLPLFRTPPHSSIAYAGRPLLLPIGISGSGYGVIPATADLTGKISSPVTVGGSTLGAVAGLNLDAASIQRKDNFITNNLLKAVAPNVQVVSGIDLSIFPPLVYSTLPNFTGTCRAHVTWNAGANQGDFYVGLLSMSPTGVHQSLTGFLLKALDDTTDLGYAALPANGTVVSVRLFLNELSEGTSLLIDVANPLTMLQDILAGKFSQLYRAPEAKPPGKNYGDPRRSFSNTISAASQPELAPARFIIDKPVDNALDWIQKQLLKPYGLALVVDGSGSFSVVDMRLPTSTGSLPLLTDADIVADDAPAWSFDRDQAIFRAEGTLWEDLPLQLDAIRRDPAQFPEMTKLLMSSVDHAVVLLGIGSGDFGEKTWKTEGEGYRVMAGDANVGNRNRTEYLQQKMLEQFNLMRRPYAHGETVATLRCRRTALVAALVQGQVIQCGVSTLPDPSTGKRGGTRVVRLVELTRNALSTDLRILDLGVATVAGVPALSGLALGSDPRHTATILVTLNAAVPAEVRFALTNGGAIPADTDPAWHYYVANPVTATATITLEGLTPGMRLWVQARSAPTDRSSLLMPSAWVSSGLLDLTGYATPSVVTITGITGSAAKVTWTNGTSSLFVEVWLRSPNSGPYTRVAYLLPGSNQFVLSGLTPSTVYGVQVNYRSLFGVSSGSATNSFTTTSGLTIPIMPPPPRRYV